MADFFTHFWCLLDVGTPDNAARALDLYRVFAEEAAREDPPSEDFRLSIHPDHGGSKLWMYDETTGDPQQVIDFAFRCAVAFGLRVRPESHDARARRRTRIMTDAA
ncbi:hypothetical protein LCGC14_0555310 [marine sediment metagenome]|uniref:Uncharacterized protein n=1 Tax=marine sediment metagenome TaxID=412755 RepID=A0A0F9RNJ1_9ZZZZ